ncbi:MAG TPA: aspartate 1-decarboxylase [Pirellulales bacterium]
MLRTMLNGKIHRAKVTSTDLHYVGSITVDRALLDAANILPYERVQVVDLENGNRFETYTMVGEPNSGVIQVNGAAAHLVRPGDRVIIMAYVQIPTEKAVDWKPTVVIVDENNVVVDAARTTLVADSLGGPE